MTTSQDMPMASSGSSPGKAYTFFGRLRVRLFLLILIAVGPALLLLALNAVEQRQAGLKNALESAQRLSHMASFQQDRLIDNARQLLTTLAPLHDMRHLHPGPAQTIFTNVMRLHPIYANLGLIDLSGQLVASGLHFTNPVYAGDRSYFQQATSRQEFVIGEYQVGRLTRTATLNLAYPVHAPEGSLAGVVFAALDLGWMYRFHEEADLPPGSSFTVYDRNHVTLARFPDPDRGYVGQLLSTNRDPSQAVTVLDRRPIDRSLILVGRDGVERLYVSTALGIALHNEVRVTVGIPTAVVFAEANHTLWRNLYCFALVTLIALAAARWGGDYLVRRPVHALLNATVRLQAGELQARTGVTRPGGELEELSRTFDAMADQLERQFAERYRAEAALQTLNASLERRVADRTQKLERSNQDLEQFAYVASHDLQEPLRMVTSYLGLLEQRYSSNLDSDAREFIGFAVNGAKRMRQLIHDLLAYSRLQTKAGPHVPVALDQVLDRVLENLQVTLRETGARIERAPLPVVLGDASQLGQLLQNLLSNALKFRGPEPLVIRVGAARTTDVWDITVADNGIGISPQHFERVFTIFQRLHPREKYPGTGIGLSICKRVVERHRGRIWVESEEGRGTTFHFTLPVNAQPEDEEPHSVAAPVAGASP